MRRLHSIGNAHDSCRMQVTSQVAESASGDCKSHCNLVSFFLSLPPGYCCKILRDSNIKKNYKWNKIKKTASDVTRGSASESVSAHLQPEPVGEGTLETLEAPSAQTQIC